MSFHEIRKYKELVIKKSGMSEKDYDCVLNELLKNVRLVADELIFKNLEIVFSHSNPTHFPYTSTYNSININRFKKTIPWVFEGR